MTSQYHKRKNQNQDVLRAAAEPVLLKKPKYTMLPLAGETSTRNRTWPPLPLNMSSPISNTGLPTKSEEGAPSLVESEASDPKTTQKSQVRFVSSHSTELDLSLHI